VSDLLYDTTWCPLGCRCEACGREGVTVICLAVTDRGPFCWSGCPRCAASTMAPETAASTALRLFGDHVGHVVARAVTRATR
jgi:hypothetical protein